VFLDRACSGQPALRKLVEALLEENDRLTGFLSPPLHNFAACSADPASSHARMGGETYRRAGLVIARRNVVR
jgi:hypothetical protein